MNWAPPQQWFEIQVRRVNHRFDTDVKAYSAKRRKPTSSRVHKEKRQNRTASAATESILTFHTRRSTMQFSRRSSCVFSTAAGSGTTSPMCDPSLALCRRQSDPRLAVGWLWQRVRLCRASRTSCPPGSFVPDRHRTGRVAWTRRESTCGVACTTNLQPCFNCMTQIAQ